MKEIDHKGGRAEAASTVSQDPGTTAPACPHEGLRLLAAFHRIKIKAEREAALTMIERIADRCDRP
jgi:hypothetical protein